MGPVPLLVAGGVALAGGAAYAIWGRKSTGFRVTSARPGVLLKGQEIVKYYGTPATPVGTISGKTIDPEPQGIAGTEISRKAGWEPVWVEWTEGKWLEWGACFYQWQQDLSKQMGDSQAQQKYINAIGKLVDWTLGLTVVIKWLIESALCFRLYIPALRIKLSNGQVLWGPMTPSGLPNGPEPGRDGALVVEGWNPGTTRIGFPAIYTKWPLEWPPPPGVQTGAWIRNVGDVWNVGHDVYQMVSASYGVERSWPLMTQAGWRAVLRIGRPDTGSKGANFPANPFKATKEDLGVLRMFDTWRGPDQKNVERDWASKKRAMNRYK